VIELAKVLDWFDGKLDNIDKAIVAEVELGLGPLHTAFRRARQCLHHAVPGQPGGEMECRRGDQVPRRRQQAKYVVDRLDVQYQPGHINASQSETMAADGKWLACGLQVLQGSLTCRWARCIPKTSS
jgi:nitrous-oxide reductase